ncbi:MAG: glucose 1-dehydrogenase [Thermoflavifilum sp.]|nr:glucose 1-dehydrogenase [Thermoflavifilum sp.]MCL6514056.1 3-oxoacyl-ACP reductase FabG [Alicyclobacillus sp.]
MSASQQAEGGRVVIVTGAARGIGHAIARRFAASGHRVVVADLDGDGAERAAAELREDGADAIAVRCDICSRADVDAMVAAVRGAYGWIDVLVNNAGWDKVEPFIDSTEETWRRIVEINLLGPIRCTQAVLREMIPRRYGKIISIGSDAGRVGSTGEAVYSAAKGGVIAFTKTVAREVARYGINVNAVCPGPTDTALLAEVAGDNPNLVEALKRSIPFRRLGTPEDIAGAVHFLASDEAAYITGQTLSVSGGLTMC